MDIIQFISVAGIGGIIGSLLTTVVQSWLSNKSHIANRNFKEKKEAYIGLMEAFRMTCLKSGQDERNNFAYWAVRCDLVAPKEIRNLVERMKTENYEQQKNAFEEIKRLIRKDLGVQFGD
jgi:hypothetical protein